MMRTSLTPFILKIVLPPAVVLFLPKLLFAQMVVLLPDEGCVEPGGIVIFENELYPAPLTAKTVRVRGFEVSVCPKKFPTESLRIAKRYTKKHIERIRREKKFLREIFKIKTPERMWDWEFVLPVEGVVSRNFGVRRIINGKPSGFHRGIDIKAPAGTPVRATNHGKVVVAGKFTLEGNLVVIDHGEGLFSIYAHLSKISVKPGQVVRKGQVIGYVGSTGRATGPHLHFGMKLKGYDVNPEAFQKLAEKVAKNDKKSD